MRYRKHSHCDQASTVVNFAYQYSFVPFLKAPIIFYYCLPLPFAVQVICRVVEVLVTGYAERHQSLLIFCHRNDIKVEELDFSFKPALRWINVGPSLAVGLVHFAEQGFVPFPVDMPMLHSVGNIRRLNHMFDYNCRLATHNILWRFVC
jgi:hypothetical protein